MNVFAQRRTWQRAKRLSLSQLACLGRHTVTGLLCAGGQQFTDWSADYRLFSQYQWDEQQLFAPIRRGVLELSDPDMPFVTALDDTHIKKTGTHIPGVAWRRDPLSPPFNVNFIRARRFIQLSAMLPCGETPTSARAIPVRYEHSPPIPKPKDVQKNYLSFWLAAASAGGVSKTRTTGSRPAFCFLASLVLADAKIKPNLFTRPYRQDSQRCQTVLFAA